MVTLRDGNFNPRFPWGKRRNRAAAVRGVSHFNPRFPWGKRRVQRSPRSTGFSISIHASRGGSDKTIATVGFAIKNFNPRFPWGKRLRNSRLLRSARVFQSTLPVGEATNICFWIEQEAYDFNPRFPWGKRHTFELISVDSKEISIHASRGGSDRREGDAGLFLEKFQSTLPVGEATIWPLLSHTLIPFQSTLPVGEATGRID